MENFLMDVALPDYTRDRQELEQYQTHAVFGYGRIKENVPILSSAYSVERMSLLIRKEDSMAIAIRLPQVPRSRVYGVLYALTTEQLIKLDTKTQNGVMFERKRVAVYVHSVDDPRELEELPRPAFCYVGMSENWRYQALNFNGRDHALDEDRFRLANRYIDNNPILHGHYRYADKRLEDTNNPVIYPLATVEVAEHCRAMNEQEAKRRWFFQKKPNRGMQLRRKFAAQLNELRNGR